MTLRGFRETLQLTDGEPQGPGPSGGHEHHQGLAATRLTFGFQQRKNSNKEFVFCWFLKCHRRRDKTITSIKMRPLGNRWDEVETMMRITLINEVLIILRLGPKSKPSIDAGFHQPMTVKRPMLKNHS